MSYSQIVVLVLYYYLYRQNNNKTYTVYSHVRLSQRQYAKPVGTLEK